MNLVYHNILKLESILELIHTLPEGLFTKQQPLLNNTAIGQHIRHILEFYQRLIAGATEKIICYDARERDTRIESDTNFAQKVIFEITSNLSKLGQDRPVVFRAGYSEKDAKKEEIQSSLERELAYALDHTIHHLAIVKIILTIEEVKVDDSFGVAPSTLRYHHGIQSN